MRRRERGFTLIELLMVVAIVGVLAAIAIPNMLVAIQRAKQKRTMANIKAISLAWESRASDFSQYNAAGAILGASAPIVISDVAAMLEPTYIKSVPRLDGWSRNYNIFLDKPIGSGHADRYVIVSSGADGTFEATPVMGVITNFDCDIVFSNGSFMSYPPQ